MRTLFAVVLCTPVFAALAAECVLTRDGRALLPVVVAPQASAAVRGSAEELAATLGRLSGATFAVQTGDGSSGIVVGTPAAFTALPVEAKFGGGPFDREDYLLRSSAGALHLLGASDLAVSHAVWDLLHRLGHRQFFPGPTWEVLPPPGDLRIDIDTRQRPAFHARRIWYNWGLWGYNEVPYKQWCVRNRMVKGFDLNSGHAYDAIYHANKQEFEAHPEYLALVKGVRRAAGGDIKFCISNPGLRKLVVDHAVRMVRSNPGLDSISMDPSDGDNWCECPDCAALSVSTRVVTLANAAAAAINALELGPRYVGTYAYNRHSAPPDIRVHPNVIVSATTAFIGGGFTFDQVVNGWQQQGATIGVYDYLSVVDWDWNMPRAGGGSRPAQVAGNLLKFHGMGARFYDAESGDCWGPCGLGYYTASRVLWDTENAKQSEAITEDFLTRAFGPAREALREFYRLTTADSQRRSHSDLHGRMYRQLAAARATNPDAAVRARLDALILYTRHAELYAAFADGRGSRDDVMRHAWRIRETMMVHSYGLWCRLLDQRAALDPNHPLKKDPPYAAADIDAILREGIAKNGISEPGFEGKEFSQKLAPAAARLKLPDVPAGSFPTAPQDHQRFHVWLPKGVRGLDLKITVQKVWANRAPYISLASPLDVTVSEVAGSGAYKPDGQSYDIALNSPYEGLHTVKAVDGGDHTRIQWPAGIPVTLESGIDTPHVTSQFRGPWTLYFYVPKGTRNIGGWASRVASWASRISGKLRDSAGVEHLDFGKLEDGWFNVPVPPGQDGTLWKFEHSQGQRLLMTVPPYLARTAAELLLPEEVLNTDEK